jgi:hypothetical protein
VTHSLLLWLDNKNNGREEEKKRFHVAAQFMGNTTNRKNKKTVRKRSGKKGTKRQ